MKDGIFGVLQRVGRSFMLPIALLPVAGLLLGVGSSFTNPTTLEAYGLDRIIYEGGILYTILDVMSKTGSVVFDNLALLFAMGVAIGMAKKEKEVAALSGAIAYLVMNASIGAMIDSHGGVEAMRANSTASVLGITTLQMGVFGGIIVGLGVAALHNRFYKIKLCQVLSFFGGTRFVPIISALVYVAVGIGMYYVWPIVQTFIASLGNLVLQSGYFGTWIYGIIERALIPFGLHHVFYMPFWQTELGGSMIVDGTLVQGAQNIFFAQLGSKTVNVFSSSATRFMAGKFPFMIFGLPAAALAMYKTAKQEKKKEVSGLLLSAALTSMITGITEPLEFTFLFVAPVMYAVHCVLAGLSYMLMHILNVGVGMTFSGGLIDLTLFGILQGNTKTNWLYVPLVGIVYAVIYYFVFYFMITRMNLKTPGREGENEKAKLYTRADMEQKGDVVKKNVKKGQSSTSFLILKGLGGKENISDIDCCATRLRISVKDGTLVDEVPLKDSGASGVIIKGNGVQVIYGPQVSIIKSNLEDYMENECDVLQSEDFESVIETKDSTPTRHLPCMLYSYMNGNIVALEKVPDKAFSEKILGDGVAIDPSEGVLYSPCEGVVEKVFDTKHAISIISNDGCEILLHVGIDTVKLGGEYFEVHVKEKEKVNVGDKLISFDIEKIRKEKYSIITPLVICNSDEYHSIRVTKTGKVSVGETIMENE